MNKKASIYFIFTTLVIDAIGLGIIIPVLPDVIRRFLSDEASISRIYGYFIATYALLQFISGPILGRLSDHYGRRPVLLLSLFGTGIDYLFMALAPTLPLIFIGRIVSGISGASFTVASAYIADISDDSNRSKNFGMMGAGFGLGFILGPAIGGLLASHGNHHPFLAAGVFNLLNFLFGYFILPESLAPEKRRAFDRLAFNPFSSLKAVLQMPQISILLIVHFLIQLAGQTHPSIWTLYTEHRFGWTASQVGMSLAIVGILSAFSQGALTGPIVKRFGERKVLAFGSIGQTLGFLGFALAVSPIFFYGALVFASVFWTTQPALQSLISREVGAHRQGELQGVLMSLTSITAIINPLIMTHLFAWTSHSNQRFYLPGSPYFLAAVFLAIACTLSIYWERNHPLSSKP